MASANFNSLSAELICLILQSIHSARDLDAFLQASSFAYRAFKVQKDLILWHLAQCAMVPEVLMLAVTAVKLRNVDCASNGAEKEFRQISALVADKLLGGHYRPTLPHDLMSSADLARLCQLQSVVEYFIHNYCSQELPVPFSSSSSSRTPAADLSPTELARLSACFLRVRYTTDKVLLLAWIPGSVGSWHDPRPTCRTPFIQVVGIGRGGLHTAVHTQTTRKDNR
jgi:hypothetical protein